MSHDSELSVLNSETDVSRTISSSNSPEAFWVFPWLRDSWKPLLKTSVIGCAVCILIAFLIPARYEAVARLMPPDQVNASGALMSALMANGGDFLAGLGGATLGMHSSGATIVGVLNSRTVQDDIVNEFDLRQVYGEKRLEDARRVLQNRSSIAEDRKSGIITIAVQDRSPERAAKLAQAYVDDLNSRVANLTTSAAHRERVFLEDRLGKVKDQLDRGDTSVEPVLEQEQNPRSADSG